MRHLHLMAGLASAALACGPMTATERVAGRYLRGPDHPTEPETKTVEQLAAEVKKDFDKRFDELKAVATDALGKAEKGEPMTKEAKEKADEALLKFGEIKQQLEELEQKIERRPADDEKVPNTPGYQFINDEEVKSFLENPSGGKRVGIETKAIISGSTADADGSAGDLVVPDRRGLIAALERRLTVRDLLMPGRTNSSSIQYPQETGFTNAAATVSETTGPTKPQSDIKFDIETTPVTTIAHWVLATRQILDDAPMLQSYIDGRLRYGLSYAEELQLLHGDGTGTNLTGVYTAATPLGANPGVVTFPNKMDVIRYAMLQASLALVPPSGVVMHPTDWASIELLKDDLGRYIIGDPQGTTQKRLWNLPVVDTPAMILDKFLVGAFNTAAQIFDRQDARVELSTEDSDNFRKNLVTILAEERLGLAVYRPEGFVKGDFSDAITDITS